MMRNRFDSSRFLNDELGIGMLISWLSSVDSVFGVSDSQDSHGFVYLAILAVAEKGVFLEQPPSLVACAKTTRTYCWFGMKL